MTPPKLLAEFFFCLIGLIFILAGVYSIRDKDLKNRVPAAAFWWILAFAFVAGPWVPTWLIGACVIALGAITAIWGVGVGKVTTANAATIRDNANKIGYRIFVPAVVMALVAVVVAMWFGKIKFPTSQAVGVGALTGLVVALLITRAPVKHVPVEAGRLTMAVGPVSILPQLLAALGAVFTAAGVGAVISKGVSAVVPHNSAIFGVIAYCLGMAIFTMIMGNAFAAFSVITVGIGIPFVVQAGGNPLIVSTLGLTAGYCGTLMTPMAANFNILPVALLEMKDKYGVIKSQAPFAILLLIVHMVLMYTLAF